MSEGNGAVVVAAEGLTKYYGKHKAVENLHLKVHAGEIYALLGPNGAGKTTALLMLLGIITPTSGRVLLFGEALRDSSFALKRRIGVVSEYQNLYTSMTVWEYLAFFADLYSVNRKEERIEYWLTTLQLADYADDYVGALSHGMRQKLGLIRALLHDPDLLILDEPTSGLDARAIEQVRRLIQAERKRGKAILFSSHILTDVERLADRVGILHQGRLLVEGDMEQLCEAAGKETQVEVQLQSVLPEVIAALRRVPCVRKVLEENNRLLITTSKAADSLSQISQAITSAGGVILSMQTKRASLEEAFLTITNANVTTLVDGLKDR